MEGWIKIHRKMIDWEWYDDNNTKVLFIHLLLTANHKEKKWKGQTILRGQKLTSLEHLAEETSLSVQQVRTSLKKLKSTNEITIKSTSKNTLITIEKYSSYQDKDDEDNKQNNTQNNKQITNEQQTNNKQITTNKKDKNDKNEKNVRSSRKNAIEFYNNNINLLTPYEFQKLQDYDDMEEELVIYAMQKATTANARNFNYIDSILRVWKAKGIKTLIQAQNEDNQFRKGKQLKDETDEERIKRKIREMEEYQKNAND